MARVAKERRLKRRARLARQRAAIVEWWGSERARLEHRARIALGSAAQMGRVFRLQVVKAKRQALKARLAEPDARASQRVFDALVAGRTPAPGHAGTGEPGAL